ncbi:MAG: NADH-quinone oxidoreductase subunit A [Thiohalocapsa sp.]|jgi:NADH-quinone oxidoreductase subunit A|uniref:NADH-quinone oxidoreductase subunit A n=1 Tax=Thiohalocapsa sp. TaxID=2497641 RepID=UPI0025D0397F|nr:NADH-quinone oxidoreductase subunit A [Thiohalocapsa sp.]MCG6943697.1 NADH-quinone oxidoreductase subunit A [Thiohalocapsa sp.]
MTGENLYPLLIYVALVLLVIGGLIALSYVLGQRHQEPATGEPFESGIVHIGSGWLRIPVRFYLVAVLFVIFDLEAAFIFAWAVAARQTGWDGYIEILVFIGILAAALAYLWRVGALDWHRNPAPETR